MWTIVSFQPTSFFSLRPANATTSGGKTLVTPTPYAIKMALLDVALRVYGQSHGEAWFPYLRDLQIAICLPKHLAVINTFVKVLRPHKSGPKDTFGTGLEGPMGNTIAYRELVHFGGAIKIAARGGETKENVPPLSRLFSLVHYLGKRGGFMQFTEVEQSEQLPNQFTRLNSGSNESFVANGLMQLLDDCGPKMTFVHVDVYNDKNISIGKPNGRILNHVVIPYQLVRSSRAYSLYEFQS